MKRNSTTAFPRTYAIKSVTTVILFDMIDLDGATETIWPRLLVFIWRTFFFLSSSTCVYYDFHFEIKENDNNKIWFSILWSVNMADIYCICSIEYRHCFSTWWWFLWLTINSYFSLSGLFRHFICGFMKTTKTTWRI